MIIALFLVLTGVIGCLIFLPELFPESKAISKLIAMLIAIVLAGPLAALSWFKGGYIPKE